MFLASLDYFTKKYNTMKKINTLLCLLFLHFGLLAQRTDSLTQDLRWRNIGPANMMGRIAAVEALPTDYRQVLVASASGGVFKSTNGGITWQVIFDTYGTSSIGAVAMWPANPDIIWVGTGEAANRNSSGWGDGIYKSTDGGKTFMHLGLSDTHHIAEIALHPTDSNIAYVAAVGHLWGFSGERGLFKTTDGGTTWHKLTNGLPDDGKTGCTEIIMHPQNPDILFAGFYERLSQPASFYSGGPNGGLYKSTDGGRSWRKITKGLAAGPSGMIDISIHLANPDIMVMAYEADENIPAGQPGSGVYRSDDGGESWRFLLKHAVRPFYHGQIEIDPLDPNNIYVVSRDFRISNDGGRTFHPRRWRTDGGDDHDMWIAPYDNKIMYLATDQGARLTVDGGKNFLSFNNMAIGQYYAIGVDMRDPYYIVGGLQDNGLWLTPSNSREWRGILNEHSTWLAEGDGFHAQIDPTDWRTAYLVNHVGFAVRVDILTRKYQYITPTPETIVNFNDYFDPDFPEEPIRYTINPGEHWFFYEYADRPLLPSQFRFNWNSPLVLSPAHPQTVYFAGNYLFKSTDRGAHWRIISPDLTTNDPALRNPSNGGGLTRSNTGGENHFTIVTVAESPLDDREIWVGTDDGNVQLTRDGGTTWTNLKPNISGIPQKIWVSRVEPSHHDAGTAYVSFDNHRLDDFKPYVYRTTDYGRTWQNITANLPAGYSVYVVREDPVNPNLLFVGTEQGVFVCLNGRAPADRVVWHPLRAGLPTVAVYDLVIHPREGDLIAATHGRSLWILDDLSALRQMSAEIAAKPLHIFTNRRATDWLQINTGRKQPAFEFRGENPYHGALIDFYAGQGLADSVTIRVANQAGDQQQQWRMAVHTGINRAYWGLSMPYTAQEVVAYRQHLLGVCDTLMNRVKRKELKKELKQLKKDLRSTHKLEQLNKLRKQLVSRFNGYAGGQPLFGAKLLPRHAEPGVYQVEITDGHYRASGSITLRADPLLQE